MAKRDSDGVSEGVGYLLAPCNSLRPARPRVIPASKGKHGFIRRFAFTIKHIVAKQAFVAMQTRRIFNSRSNFHDGGIAEKSAKHNLNMPFGSHMEGKDG